MTNNQLTDQKLTKIIESAEAVISALAGHNDDVHPDDSTKMCRLWDALNDDDATPEVVLVMAKDLQERRKADSEPAMYIMGMGHALDVETASTCKGAVDSWVDEWNQRRLPGQAEYKTVPLYRHAQPAPVVPEEWTIADAVKFCKETGRQDAGAAMDAWNACRAAMCATDKSSNHADCQSKLIKNCASGASAKQHC
ncbi:hypothetical protein EGH67_05820 [Klebsiella aerogenes]|uniref:hypothetical protein n=1 Tax=Klebsiella aerogenes TaxID=548 RepID=UPI000F7EA5AA|nr:hypothetical protein [Klebsiella aerogenes]EKV8477965.1 hypothetical protein [Klebsiella aerogenes]RSV69106.1 hypothetical protein EGH60_17190 [Klebsiella aerogenes]RSV69560.1 hypothetical protein EGH59_16150 [Klebsiella aerogenes]RSV81812.1 hypothetical protein EGH58_02580 [Klebsiella aerogenes]RSW06286.1 hypothetical protein EGH54_08420 [Klebsiella aerogenes]